jgi:hypothetical protein
MILSTTKTKAMKPVMLRSLSLFGVSVILALSAAAQEEPKVKINDHEYKYKSEDVKVKLQREEDKYKTPGLKIKDNGRERKVKGWVKPMRITTTERTVIKTGETQVATTEHLAPATASVEPATPKTATVKKSATRKYASRKATSQKRIAARKTNSKHRYAVHRKAVRHSASQPKQVAAVQTVYVHDTVFITRVDTVLRLQRMNTYSGYRVPRGDFKKVKFKRDNDGRVWMKRKE